MPNMRNTILGLCLAIGASVRGEAQQPATARHPLSVDEFLLLERPSEPAISPDAKWTVYTVTTTDMKANRRRQDLWMVASTGGTPRRLTDDSLGGRAARWSPD